MANNLGFGGNNYLAQAVSDSLGDTVKAYNNTTAPAYTSSMVRSGSFGNSGLEQAQNESQRQLQQSLGRQANDMYSNNYQFNDNFNRQVYNDTFNQGQQNFQNGINLLGLQNASNQQNLGFGTQVQNTPLNYYQGFSNTANGLGHGYGTQSNTSSAPNSSFASGLGGAQLASSIENSRWFGDWIGA